MAKRWYIVHAYSNLEPKVAESIKERARMAGLEAAFEEIVVPSEDVIEIRRGRKIHTQRRLFPGYVFVKMDMNDYTVSLIRNTPKVTGFLGAENKPIPISDAEAATMLNRVKETTDAPRPVVLFEVGEQVRVADGPFESLTGTVEDIDEERARLKVAVSIFGRPTPVELEFNQVQKLAG